MFESSLVLNPLFLETFNFHFFTIAFFSSSLFSSFVSFPISGIHQSPKSMRNLYQPSLEPGIVWRANTTRAIHCCTLVSSSLEPEIPAHLSLEPDTSGVNHSGLWPAHLGLTYTHISLSNQHFTSQKLCIFRLPEASSVKHREDQKKTKEPPGHIRLLASLGH